MGGKGSGGYRKGGPPKHNPVVDGNNPMNVDAEANHWSIELGKRLMHMEPPDYSDPDAIIERFEEYLAICDELHMRPLMQGTAMAFGMNREMFSGIVHGRYTKWKNITPESIHAMQKCHDFLQLNWENQLSTEKGNPVNRILPRQEPLRLPRPVRARRGARGRTSAAARFQGRRQEVRRARRQGLRRRRADLRASRREAMRAVLRPRLRLSRVPLRL